jgi:integrase
MKQPSHLAKSRHGVFYFRLSFRTGSTIKEKRISLKTKNPQEARFKSSCLSAIMLTRQWERQAAMEENKIKMAESIAGQGPDSDFLLGLLQQVDRQQLSELAGVPLSEVNQLLEQSPQTNIRKLDIEMPGGFTLRNISSDEDMNRAVHILQTLNLSADSMAKLLAGPNPAPIVPVAQVPVQKTEEGGTTIQEMVPRYASRKRNMLVEKTLYEYGNYHRKFVEWLELRKKKKHIPIHSITRADVADFIDDLLAEGLASRTISQKYLAAINGLFTLARTTGVLPEGQPLVSSGHKVFSKRDAKKSSDSSSYKSFTEDELQKIFHQQFLSEAKKPVDFWAPLLGLFTGARLNELCQLDIKDIQQHGEIWAIHFIDDEPDKSLKSPAARRLIPIHPTLIELGFLDYWNDAKQFLGGRKLFPYLSYSKFDGYASTPSDRWGKYLDSIEITDRKKVFHSFRSTSNDCLKQNGVPEESRCQFIGHEHDTINSTAYSNPHNLQYLLENVARNLNYPMIEFKLLKYKPGQFSKSLASLCTLKTRAEANKQAKERRKNGK